MGVKRNEATESEEDAADGVQFPAKKPRVEAPEGKDTTPPAEHKSDSLLELAVTRCHWHGLDSITDIVAFGDSSTQFGTHSTWLGHLLRALNKGRKKGAKRVQAHNYAAPGHTVEDDLADQMDEFFKKFPKRQGPDSVPPLNPDSTLYVFWLGINDCSRTDPDDLDDIVDKLFEDGLDELFVKAGGRNFLLIGVPPKDRSPGALEISESSNLSERYTTWNELLQRRAEAFAEDSAQASVLLFSAYKVVSDILDNPEEYDFPEDDVTEEGSAIWLDSLHMTSDVHEILAGKLMKALRAVGGR